MTRRPATACGSPWRWCPSRCLLAVIGWLMLVVPLQARASQRARVPLARAVIPHALMPPTVDGKPVDLAWRAPSTVLPAFVERNGARTHSQHPSPAAGGPVAHMTCDPTTVYLLVRQDSGADTELTIQFGPAPRVRRQLVVTRDGGIRSAEWTGWEWNPAWQSRARVRVATDQEHRVTELALSRGEIGPACSARGARVALRLSIEMGGGRQCNMDLTGGLGVLLGVETALSACTWTDDKAGSVEVQVTTWQPHLRDAVLRVFTEPGTGDGAFPDRLLCQRDLSGLATGTRHVRLPCGADAFAQAVRLGTVRLQLQVSGTPLQTYAVEAPQPAPLPDQAAIRGLLTRGRVHPAAPLVQGLFADADEHLDAGEFRKAAACLTWVLKETRAAPEDRLRDALSAHAAAGGRNAAQLGRERNGADVPEPQDGTELALGELARLAEKRAASRPAFLQRVRLDALQQSAATWDAQDHASLASLLQGFREWQRFSRAHPPQAGPVVPTWRPALAAQRLQALAALLAGPFSAEAGQGVFLDCLGALVRHQRYLISHLERCGENVPLDPSVLLRLAAVRARLGALGRAGPLPAQLARLAALQLEAHVNPDGSGRVTDDQAIQTLHALWLLRGLRPPLDAAPGPAPSALPIGSVHRPKLRSQETGEAESTAPQPAAAERLLAYLADRVLPNGRVPWFGARPRPMAERDMAAWAEEHIPERLALRRFRPEGLAAVPLERSTPATSQERVYGGLYVLRAHRADVAAAVYAPAGFSPTRSRAAQSYGGVLLATRTHDLLVEPAGGIPDWRAPVCVDGLPPLAASLPERGAPLPHRWITTPRWDHLTVAWRVTAPGQAPAQVVRRVFLAKGRQPYLYIADALRSTQRNQDKNAHTSLVQRFALGPHAAGRLSLGLVPRQTVAQNGPTSTGKRLLSIRRSVRQPGLADLVWRPVAEDATRADDRSVVIPDPAVERLSPVPPEGGGVVHLDLGGGHTDFLASRPQAGSFAGTFGGRRIRLDGLLAVFRLGPMGLRSVACVDVREASLERRTTWTVRFSRPTTAAISVRPDGSYAVRLEAPIDRAVALTLTVAPGGRGRVKQATADLLAGRTVVFRPL